MSFQLNAGQQAAVARLMNFLSDPDEQMICISGPAGTGKSTVVKTIVQHVEDRIKTKKLLGIESNLKIILTATTNKACESLAVAMELEDNFNYEIRTIHSILKLSLEMSKTFVQHLIDTMPHQTLTDCIVIVDEASYIDDELIGYIRQKMCKPEKGVCKFIFLGDEAQLTNTGSKEQPVFTDPAIPKIELTEVMRQDKDNPIFKLSMILRNAILTKQNHLPPCIIDNNHITWLPRDKLEELMIRDMTSPDWVYTTSKFLAFRNKTVQKYNKMVYQKVTGETHFKSGDMAINNNYIKNSQTSIATDRMVTIEKIEKSKSINTTGHSVTINGVDFFMPEKIQSKDLLLARYRNEMERLTSTPIESLSVDENSRLDTLRQRLKTITSYWIDLRPVYAQTVYKAQGATYRRVYIDLNDLSACRDIDSLMRMLYVGISRAKMQVFLTGDI